jgi:hypothetical protein
MFRFTQEPSSGSRPVLSQNYKYGFSVLVSMEAVNVMVAYQPVVQACGSQWRQFLPDTVSTVNRTPSQQADMPP